MGKTSGGDIMGQGDPSLSGNPIQQQSKLGQFGQAAGKNSLAALGQSLGGMQQPQQTMGQMPQIQQPPMMQLPDIQQQVPKWAQKQNFYGG